MARLCVGAFRADITPFPLSGRVVASLRAQGPTLQFSAQLSALLLTNPSAFCVSSTLGVRVYFVSTHRRCLVFAFVSGLHFLRITLTHPHPALHPQPQSTLSHAPPLALAQTPHHPLHPFPALHSLTPQSRLFTQLTPASSSLTPLEPHPYGANSSPLCACATEATTRRDLCGAAGPLRSQNDGVNALLLPLVISHRSYFVARAVCIER